MSKHIHNCAYDKLKLLVDLSKLVWFIEKHAQEDSRKANDEKCFGAMEDIVQDLEKHIMTLKSLVAKDMCK